MMTYQNLNPHGLLFHHFHNESHHAGQGAISANELDAMLSYVGLERILSAEEWAKRALAGTLSGADVCLTFDDCLCCQFDVALPVLRRYSLTAFWFVYTSIFSDGVGLLEVYRKFRHTCFVSVDHFYCAFYDTVAHMEYGPLVMNALDGFEPSRHPLAQSMFYSDADIAFRFVRDEVLDRKQYEYVMNTMIDAHGIDLADFTSDLWMNAEHLQELKRTGHIIGLHSHSHPTALKSLPPDAQRHEYETNKRLLTNILGEEPIAMSHPSDSYNAHTLSILCDLGIQVGFASHMAAAAPSVLEFPREDHALILAEM